jgi:ribonucleoside-diphosphate reductase alpha chain
MSAEQITDDWEIPVKRVTGDSIEERLLDKVVNGVLPGRYLNKNENGDVVEDVTELFKRVGRNIALAEVVYEANKLGENVWVTPDQIKPNHPRRGKLAGEAFGFDGRDFNSSDELPKDLEEAKEHLIEDAIKLTEENVSKFAYDTVVPQIESEEVKNHVEHIADQFINLMETLGWMPNSPTIMNAGSELQQLSACFVISPEDDISDIYETQKEAAEIFQSGGGCGYAFSDLRPYGDTVGSTGGIASGPITFMRSYDEMCETIAQGGARRGAQMGVMRITHPDIIQFIHAKNKDVSLAHALRLNDPDDYTHNTQAEALDEARELIDENGKIPKHLRNAAEGHLSNFNISVGATDDFMEAAIAGEDYTLINPRTGEPHIATEKTKELYNRFDLGDEVTVGEVLTLPADEILRRVIKGSHENGEPGLLLLDRANEEHSFPVESSPGPEHSKHEILASNPCGEQFLEEGEACNLGHINLSTLISKEPEYSGDILMSKIGSGEGDTTEQDFRIWHEKECAEGYNGDKTDPEHITKFLDQALDWEEFNKRIDLGTRFLENVCTMSDFPVDKIEKTVQENRKVGLGIMGLAQMFIQLGVRYGTPVSNEITKQLMIYINRRAKAQSRQLAVDQKRGSFANHDESKYADPVKYREWFEHQTGEDADDWEDGFPIRNHNVTTIAPTGTTSMIGNTSGGCEPIFSLVNLRNIAGDEEGQFVEMDDYFIRTLNRNDVDSEEVKEEAIKQIQNNEYTGIEGLSSVPNELSELFVTTKELSPKQHVDIQCAAQKGVDSSISKTINAPNEATIEDIREVFIRVYKQGGKGVTVYRDGTRNKQVKTTRGQNKEFADLDDEEAVDKITGEIQEAFGSIVDFLEHEDVKSELNGNAASVIKTVDTEYLPTGYAPKRPRPNTLHGHTTKIDTGYGKVYITLNEDETGNLFEVWCRIGQSGGLTNSWTEALGKTVSIAIRSGVQVDEIINALKGTRSPKASWDKGDRIDSIPDAIGTVLERYVNGELENQNKGQTQITEIEGKKVEEENNDTANKESNDINNKQNGSDEKGVDEKLLERGESPECPSCNSMSLYFSEGCKTCEECGWSEC